MLRRNPAGLSSMRKFREERRAAIRAQWRLLLAQGAVVVGCALWIAFDDGYRQILAAFLLGASLTILTFGWMLGFNIRSMSWQLGAFGERWTAEELERLGPAWSVYHDIPDGGGNWDHVVVGPGGVFAIDSKNLAQPAVVDDRGLRAGRLRFGGSATRSSSMRMKMLIEEQSGATVWVQGVVAVWGKLSDDVVERDKVLYVRATHLVDLLERQPAKLNDEQREKVKTALRTIAKTPS